MPFFLGQLFFQNMLRGAGWSEGHYMEHDSYDDALAALRLIGESRLPLFTDNTRITFLKVSDVAVKRDAIVDGDTTHSGLGSGSYDPDPATQDTFPDVALLLRYTTMTAQWGTHYLRSIPENCIINGVYSPEATWATALATYITLVQTQTLQRIKNADGDYEYTDINLISVVRISRRKAGRFFGLLAGRGRRP